MKHLFFLLALNCIGFSAIADEVKLKFEDLKQLVETRNEKIQAAHREADGSKKREGHLSRSFLPRVEAHAAQESFKTGTQDAKTQPDYGAEASVNLYNGGRDRIREKMLRVRSERKEFEIKTSVAEELGKARELFWTIVYHKHSAALLREMLDLNADNLRAAQRRIKSGVATDSDRLEFEMNAIELKRELDQTQLDIRADSRDLLILIGYEPHDTLVTESELKHSDEWESEIRHTHKDHDFLVRPSQLLSLEAESAAEEASRSWVPKVDAYAGWNQYNQREEDPADARERQESVVGLRLKMNIFDGLNSSREAQALRKEAAAAELQASYRSKSNEAHVEREFEELKFLHGKVHEADENIKSAERYYRLSQSEYSRGVKNSPDVLGASEKLFGMKLKRLEMIRKFQVARSHVLSKIGK